jgi:hypothetical protein
MNDSESDSRKRLSSDPSSDDRDSTRRRLTIPLGPVMSDLDDAAHARLDEQVLKVADDEPVILSLAQAAFLLATIVENAKGHLDQKYASNKNSRTLLEEHPDLRDKMAVAWQARSFKDIRNLGTRMPPSTFTWIS